MADKITPTPPFPVSQKSWRDHILSEFTPRIARLTIVADPDGLLLEEKILEGIRERGFELIPFEDHIAFRYAYESRFRSHWDQGKETDLVVVLQTASELDVLPYDLLQAGRKLSFSLGDIFPNLSYPVVTALDRADLDVLYDAQIKYAPGQLGDNATKDFILRHVFEIAPELIKQPSDLLRVLLRRHYTNTRIPRILDERFIQVLRQNNQFDDWPLEIIISDREAFFLFLQERWPVFLDRITRCEQNNFHDKLANYGFKIAGPEDIPFDHDDIRIYIDNLFLEGLLKPVNYAKADTLVDSWVNIGIATSKTEMLLNRIEGLLKNIENSVPPPTARYDEWFRFAYLWANLKVMSNELSINEKDDDYEQWVSLSRRIQTITRKVDEKFLCWVKKRYASLINLPAINPVMVHHLPRYMLHHSSSMSRQNISSTCKVLERKLALILVDGLSLEQWIVLKGVLEEQNDNLKFRESALFAWIPTITSVSRQAAFAGKPPLYFPGSIHSTSKEPAFWTQFWVDQGLKSVEIAYVKGLGDKDLDQTFEILARPKLRVAGLVIDKIDKIMHGMELGAAGMLASVRQWGKSGFLIQLIEFLLNNDFLVYLSSDHGNIEAKGCGRPAEGAVADLRGERVRIYSDARLRKRIRDSFPEALEWPPVGLPEDYFPLLAPDRTAFVREGDNSVCHGGISVEEVVVPLALPLLVDRKSQ